jgi:hypothetical protein
MNSSVTIADLSTFFTSSDFLGFSLQEIKSDTVRHKKRYFINLYFKFKIFKRRITPIATTPFFY